MMPNHKIKVLVIDDSMVFRESIRRGIEKDPMIEVVATAGDPYDARDKIIAHQPDVLTLDVEMPKMNGIDFLRKLMPQYPLPVVVVSSVSSCVFDAVGAGAVDFVTKPQVRDPDGVAQFYKELVFKIKIASAAKVRKSPGVSNRSQTGTRSGAMRRDLIIAIGASTGGPEAIYEVIKDFPMNMPGIVIVQHMPPVFTGMYADRLNGTCAMEVREARDGDSVRPGLVLIAPGGLQMELVKRGSEYRIRCFEGEKVNGHCPSVDVLFHSVARYCGKNAIGVILTGMGFDGAKGLLDMKKRGAKTVGQDKSSSVVYGMPKVAFDLGGVDRQVPLSKVSQVVMEWAGA